MRMISCALHYITFLNKVVDFPTNLREKRKTFGFLTIIDCKLVIIANKESAFNGEGGGGK